MIEHNGKYRALWQYLLNRTDAEVTLSFADIERILGFPLPSSSRRHAQHWHGYEGSAVARAIADAGWRARGTDLNAQRVTLYRVATPGCLLLGRRAARAVADRRSSRSGPRGLAEDPGGHRR